MVSNAASLSLMLLHQQHALQAFFMHWVGRELWEDLYQTLWIKVQEVRDDPPIENERAFLFHLARLVALDHSRREKRRKGLRGEAETILWGSEFAVAVDEQAIARDELARVTRAAAALPEPTRTIFALNRMENLTQREIAQQMRLSQTTIEKHIAKALKILSASINHRGAV